MSTANVMWQVWMIGGSSEEMGKATSIPTNRRLVCGVELDYPSSDWLLARSP
jgi:hypothetical protein